MDPKQLLIVKKYIDILLRKKIVIGVCVVIAIIGGIGKYLKTPKVYKAEALLLYQRQSVNTSKMSPDVKDQTAQIIATLTEQVTSRTNLEQLITKNDLYKEMRQKQPIEDVVDAMRENDIAISPERRGDVFRVAFQSANPDTVAVVANALASKFIEENLKFRGGIVTDRTLYTAGELEIAKKRLDEVEQRMRDYKLKYFNELPEQHANNMARLNALQTQYQEIQKSIYENEQLKVQLQEQIHMSARLRAQSTLVDEDLFTSESPEESSRQAEIDKLKESMTALLSRYTDKHPEVVRLQKRIQQLEETRPSAAEKKAPAKTGSAIARTDPYSEKMGIQLKEMDGNIERLKEERDNTRKEIEKYSKWIEAVPTREAEWAALTREHPQLRKNYEDLVARNLDAMAVENMEQQQKGSQFKIIDSARKPEKPFRPDFEKIMAIAILAGLVVGGLLAFGIELTDTSFREANDVEAELGLPVICAIPFIYTTKEQSKKTKKLLIWGGSFTFTFLCIAVGLLFLMKKGLIIL